MDVKAFRVYRNNSETDNRFSRSQISNSEIGLEPIFTLSELISKESKFLKDKIFELVNINLSSEENFGFKYVVIKMKKIRQSD